MEKELRKSIAKYFIKYKKFIPVHPASEIISEEVYFERLNKIIKENGLSNMDILIHKEHLKPNLLDLDGLQIALEELKDYININHETLSEAVGTTKDEVLYFTQFINYLDGLIFNENTLIEIKNNREYKWENRSSICISLLDGNLFDSIIKEDLFSNKIYNKEFKKLLLELWNFNHKIILNLISLEDIKNKISLDVNKSFLLHLFIFRNYSNENFNNLSELINAKMIRQMIGFASTNTMFDNDNCLIRSTVFNNSISRNIIELLNNMNEIQLYDILDHEKEWKIIFRYLHIMRRIERKSLLYKVVDALRNNEIKKVLVRKHIDTLINESIERNDMDKLLDVVKNTEFKKYEIARRVILNMNNSIIYLNSMAKFIEKELDEAKEFKVDLFKKISRMVIEVERLVVDKNANSFYNYPNKVTKTITTGFIDRDIKINIQGNQINAFKTILMHIQLSLGKHFMKYVISQNENGIKLIKELEEKSKINNKLNLSLKDTERSNICIPLGRRNISESANSLSKFSTLKIDGNFSISASWRGEDLDLHGTIFKIEDDNIESTNTCYFSNLSVSTDKIYMKHSGDVRYCPDGGQEKINVKINELIKSNTKYIEFYINAFNSDSLTAYKDKFINIFNDKDEIIYRTPLNINSQTVTLGVFDIEKKEFIFINEKQIPYKDLFKVLQLPKPMLQNVVAYAWWSKCNELGIEYDEKNTIELEYNSLEYLSKLY